VHIVAGLAEIERDLHPGKVKSGATAAETRGVVLGLQGLHAEGLSLGRLSKNTLMGIVNRTVSRNGALRLPRPLHDRCWRKRWQFLEESTSARSGRCRALA
jgi:hypothetical protein